MRTLASRIDATLLAADATGSQIEAFVREAASLGCVAACVNPVHVERAVRAATGTALRIASVAGFPLGASPVSAKIEECRFALDRGAAELDIVIPIWAVVDGRIDLLEQEIATLLAATTGATRKLILEVGLMPAGALEAVAAAINRTRPEFAKTGTGYARGATVEDAAALRRLLDPTIRIKAAGGIRSRAQALSLLDAGADRIGTSRAREILDET